MSLDLSEGESGGEGAGMMRWLLTYADMITLLMAFFIMMYSMSAINLDKFKRAASSLRSEFGPTTPSKGSGSGGSGILPHGSPTAGSFVPILEEDVKLVEDKLHDYIKQNRLQDLVYTKHEFRGLVISLVSDNLLFPVGEADLRPPALAILDRISELLRDIPNTIMIEGHTCSLPIHTPRYPSNWELSAARACAVVRYLIDRWNIDPVRLAATGCADSRPVAPNDTEEQRVFNRRVQIIILARTQTPSDGELTPADSTDAGAGPEAPPPEEEPR
jgi:chemotaxis protein MotB